MGASGPFDDDTTGGVTVQVVNDYQMRDGYNVKVSKQGDYHAETLFKEKDGGNGTIRKLDKERYVVLSSGEIKEYTNKPSEKTIPNLLRTFAKLKALIRTNFSADGDNQLFVTLTYKENMQDTERLYTDFDKFMKRLKYAMKGHKLEYIAVAEPQGRGAWHFHVMLKSDKPVLYIENITMSELWRHGTTDTQRLKSDDVGQYYIAYFTDILNAKGNEKKRKKGARLAMYPPGFKFYRKSRGIQEPIISEMEWGEVVKMYGKPIHSVTYSIETIDMETGDTKVVNVINKASFKVATDKRRKEKGR